MIAYRKQIDIMGGERAEDDPLVSFIFHRRIAGGNCFGSNERVAPAAVHPVVVDLFDILEIAEDRLSWRG